MLIRFALAATLAAASTLAGPMPTQASIPADDRGPACLPLSEAPRLVGAPARLQSIPDRYVPVWYAALSEMTEDSLSGDDMLIAVLSVPPHNEAAPAAGSGVIFMATAGCITAQVTLGPEALRRLARDVHARSAAEATRRSAEAAI